MKEILDDDDVKARTERRENIHQRIIFEIELSDQDICGHQSARKKHGDEHEYQEQRPAFEIFFTQRVSAGIRDRDIAQRSRQNDGHAQKKRFDEPVVRKDIFIRGKRIGDALNAFRYIIGL